LITIATRERQRSVILSGNARANLRHLSSWSGEARRRTSQLHLAPSQDERTGLAVARFESPASSAARPSLRLAVCAARDEVPLWRRV